MQVALVALQASASANQRPSFDFSSVASIRGIGPAAVLTHFPSCSARLVMEGRSPAVSGLTFTHRAADEKKFPALCRSAPLGRHLCRTNAKEFPSSVRSAIVRAHIRRMISRRCRPYGAEDLLGSVSTKMSRLRRLDDAPLNLCKFHACRGPPRRYNLLQCKTLSASRPQSQPRR